MWWLGGVESDWNVLGEMRRDWRVLDEDWRCWRRRSNGGLLYKK